ncbi:hypothetical protein GM672_05750 [Massilia buxea]|uniref:Uncharacterized protein n=1 Tax=Pseudoduganella buxea TaxID=1949069 RepID=A0A6I3SSV6_9BURK|nr:hypothetical protein [Pseudoduganella buxea]
MPCAFSLSCNVDLRFHCHPFGVTATGCMARFRGCCGSGFQSWLPALQADWKTRKLLT